MDFQQLRVFREAARAGGFTRASAELRLSQSTISLHIKRLEEELGTPLFLRSKKRVLLNEAGRVLLEYADRIFGELKNAEMAVRDIQEVDHGTIRLGSGATTVAYLLPKVLSAFQRKHPQTELIVTTGSSEELALAVHQQKVDLAIVMPPLHPALAIEVLPCMQEELVFVVANSHALTQKSQVRVEELADVPFISFLRDTAMRSVIEEQFAAIGFKPRITMEMENIEAIKSLVRAGLGAAVLPACSVSGNHGAMLHTFRIRHAQIWRGLALALPRGVVPPRAIQRFANLVTKALSSRSIPELRAELAGVQR